MIIFNNNSIGYVLDVDASKVIEAVRSTGVTITPAMMHYAHYLISNMKNIGTWQLSNAFYGFLGGTAASHKWNWKDLRDVDAAFRLTYSGGVTHSANGIQFDGINGYANAFFIPSTNLLNTSTHAYAYVKSSSAITLNTTPVMMAVLNSPSGCSFGLSNRHNGTNNNKIFYSTNPTTSDFILQVSSLSSPLLKSFSGNLIGGVASIFNNGVRLSTSSGDTSQTNLPSTLSLLIGAAIDGIGGIGNYDNKLLSCVTVGSGLTDTQIIQRDQIINNAQLILNRA